MEYLNDLIFHRHDGAKPDVRFYNRAYLLTMHHWSNELRISDCKLETLVQARTGWTHFWTNYTPSMSASSSSPAANGPYDMSMLPPDLIERVNQVAQITKSLSTLQSRFDKQSNGGEKRKYVQDAHGNWKPTEPQDKNKKGKGKGRSRRGAFNKRGQGKKGAKQ